MATAQRGALTLGKDCDEPGVVQTVLVIAWCENIPVRQSLRPKLCGAVALFRTRVEVGHRYQQSKKGNHVKKLLLAAIAVALLSGCAFNAETVQLNPTVPSAHSSEGQGVSVAVQVVDERASQSLGHRGGAGGAAAEITTNSDVTAVVSEQVTRALQNDGFTVLGPNAQGNANLTVEVRLLNYSTSVGFWTGGIQIEATLEAKAQKSGKSFEQMYRIKNEQRVVVVPTADKNAEWINQALSEAITKLVTDPKLLAFLAG